MLIPLGKKIIVKPVEQKQVKGSLILTHVKPTQYQILEIGDEVTKVKREEIIYLEKHHGVEIEYDNEKFLVIEESSILAKIGKLD